MANGRGPLVLGAIALTMACARSTPPPPAAEPSEPPPGPRPVWDVPGPDHDTQVKAARDALLAGSPDAVRDTLVDLGARDVATGLVGEGRAAALGATLAAATASRAEGVDELAEVWGETFVACVRCHALTPPPAADGTPVAPTPVASSVPLHMTQNVGAIDDLWRGALGLDRGAWARGTHVLSDPADWVVDAEAGDDQPETTRALAEQLSALSSELATVVDVEARARGVADVLATCAACHIASRDP